MESMKQKFFRAAVPLVMLAVSAALSVFVYRLPQPVREPLPVLMYHHMVPDGQDCNDMTVTPGKFRADLETVLAMGYTPVLPRELAAGDALPEKPILITFDDGYRSNYDLVYPILREYGVKACISTLSTKSLNSFTYESFDWQALKANITNNMNSTFFIF